jgi:hypothetical protein
MRIMLMMVVLPSRHRPARKAIALTWLFHLTGDIHQPLHPAQVFTTVYPKGDQGGNQVCVRQSLTRNARDLHGFWDGVVTSRSTVAELRNEATTLRNRSEFARNQLTELAASDFELWANESFELATKISYQNGAVPGAAKGNHKNCAEIADAGLLPAGYVRVSGRIAHRRIMLAGYRLADLLKRSFH